MTFEYPTAFCSWNDARGDGGAEERAAMDRVRASGRFTAGPEVEAFEAELATYLGRRHAVMTNSGSSANLVAASALRLALEGDFRGRRYNNVFVPAVAWSTTYAPFVQLGFDLDVRDVDETWNAAGKPYFPGGVSRQPAITVVCPVLGNALSGELVRRAGRPFYFLEDACESLGSADAAGRRAGTVGDVSTLSFFWSHQLSAIEGGAVATDDEEIARLCRLLSRHGNAGWQRGDFEAHYDFQVFGYNVAPVEMNAAIAREQLRKLGAMSRSRTENAALFRQLTLDFPIEHPVTEPDACYVPFGLPFCVPTRATRRRLADALRAEGVDCRLPTGGSFLKHTYATGTKGATPRADAIHETGMFLGCAPYPIPDLIERAVGVMRRVL